MAACFPKIPSEISFVVSNIQEQNIKDKRLVYWNIDMKTENGKTGLHGATVSEEAFNELKNLAEEQKLTFMVKLLPEADFKENSWGIVTLSVCNIRGNGRHSAELVTQAVMGTPVKVYQKVDGWYLIQTPDRYFGWVDDAAITLKTNAELVEWKKLEKVLYKNQNGFAYANDNENSAIETDLVLADLLSIIGSGNDFYLILMADGREAFVKKDECVSLNVWKAKEFAIADVLITASNFKGTPYLWGGTSAKMVDCSGFVKSSYYMHGVILQRDASHRESGVYSCFG